LRASHSRAFSLPHHAPAHAPRTPVRGTLSLLSLARRYLCALRACCSHSARRAKTLLCALLCALSAPAILAPYSAHARIAAIGGIPTYPHTTTRCALSRSYGGGGRLQQRRASKRHALARSALTCCAAHMPRARFGYTAHDLLSLPASVAAIMLAYLFLYLSPHHSRAFSLCNNLASILYQSRLSPLAYALCLRTASRRRTAHHQPGRALCRLGLRLLLLQRLSSLPLSPPLASCCLFSLCLSYISRHCSLPQGRWLGGRWAVTAWVPPLLMYVISLSV